MQHVQLTWALHTCLSWNHALVPTHVRTHGTDFYRMDFHGVDEYHGMDFHRAHRKDEYHGMRF